MKNIRITANHLMVAGLATFLFFILSMLGSCKKNNTDIDPAQTAQLKQSDKLKVKKNFTQINLVANNEEYNAARIDPLLINAWGIAWNPTGIPWISAQGSGISVVYNGEGGQVRPPVNIPSASSPTGGSPTGQVFNASTTDFLLSNGQAAKFIFVGDDGIISGWNPAAGNNALLIRDKSATAAYTGVTIAMNSGSQYLYAANFSAKRIDVFNTSFDSVTMPFTDPMIPAEYGPFNIQQIDGKLYVMYAKVGEDGDEEVGMGFGFVDVYNPNGTLVKRLASQGQLNAPWGVAKAPAGFFDDEDGQGVILVGNFGNGHINAYKADGTYFGEIWGHDKPIEIEGLWALSVAPATATSIPQGRLYFTAGPDDEAHGLFGYLQRGK